MFMQCIIFVIAFLICFKIILKLQVNWDRSPKCLIGKTTIVTGANTGIGFYTAQEFAKRGAKVILACRDKCKAELAKEEIIAATGNDNVHVRVLDLASLQSVRDFACEIKTNEKTLDILVNNAGAAGEGNFTTEDGFNLIMQVNYFGPYLLTVLLLDLIKTSAPSRIINVSSLAAAIARLNPNNLNEYPVCYFPNVINYANSKLCNILFTNELARRLEGTKVTTNSLHPGSINTQAFRNAKGYFKTLVSFLKVMFFKTPEEGAQTTIYAALSEETKNVSGKLFDNCTYEYPFLVPKAASDIHLAKIVWENTACLLKLSNTDDSQVE